MQWSTSKGGEETFALAREVEQIDDFLSHVGDLDISLGHSGPGKIVWLLVPHWVLRLLTSTAV